MKNTIQNVKIIILGLLIAGGLSYALAWSGPGSPPPGGNVAAPINVGGGTTGNIYTQTKTGLLALANLVVTNMNVASGTTSTAGSVLTNDGNGNASWAASGSGSGSIPSGALMAFALSTCPSGWSTYTAAYGRTVIGSGPSTASTSARTLGAIGGTETQTLALNQLPVFTVSMNLPIPSEVGSNDASGGGHNSFADNNATYNSSAIGGGKAVSVMQPFVAALYCEKN